MSRFDVGEQPLFLGLVRDISHRKRSQLEREMTIQFLRLMNESSGTRNLIQSAASFFQQRTRCDAVGVRLQEGSNYPYFEARGFPREFLSTEAKHCAQAGVGLLCDCSANLALECICGNVIRGQFEPSMPYFTANGSFWTNSATELLSGASEAELHFREHRGCYSDGFESVALIPLFVGEQRLGLLHLNNRAKGVFSLEAIGFWERLAGYLAAALARFRAEEALQESDRRYRLLADNTEDFVSLNDNRGNRVHISPSFFHATGWAEEDIRRKDWVSRLHPDDTSVINQARGANLAGQATVIEHRVPCRDGSWIWVEARCRPVLGDDGKVEHMVVSSRDITARKRADEQIRVLNRTLEDRVNERTSQLEAVNKEMEAFSYSVSHDHRSPLRAIHGFAKILADDHTDHLDDAGLRALNSIRRAASRMSQLIDDLLAFGRASRMPIQMAVIDVADLARPIFEECAALAPGRDIRLQLGLLESARGDRPMIRQVLANLISNAVKYTLSRSPAEIEIGSRVHDGEIEFYVRDNGVGFDMKYADNLFGLFQRMHSDAEFEGSGVGLALVQRIIHRHGGRVWAEAEVDVGTVVYFTLPIQSR